MATIKIGHARISENGTVHGNAGDQTKQEVAITNYYLHKKGWYVLRAKDEAAREKIAKCAEDACANDNIGYCQWNRLTLYNAVKDNGFKCDKKNLTKKVECDCSALVRVCCAYAGIHVANFTTVNEKSVLINSGKFMLVKWDGKQTSLRRGDILLTKTKGHTAIVLTSGSKDVPKVQIATDKVEAAKGFNKSVAGNYKTTSELNLRTGAGTNKGKIMVLPKNKQVVCYGYYTTVGITKWLLVRVDNKTGFCSSKYLKRV